jgi:3-dehydroquinate dehydratase
MGEHGLVTRIFGTLWGNPIVFAPVTSSHASAPGQLTREEFAEIFALLEGEHT